MDAPTLQSGSSLCPINVDVIAASSRFKMVWFIYQNPRFLLKYSLVMLAQYLIKTNHYQQE